ncbi:DUF2125 domain-containing protein [Tropicibacter alexandrii]|uniref:DUF2125 domain-containing protein n=1 Tax=Tropicibacter alexandrii TaxID=2267683 RepID=UPI000EF54AEE|nr:DUF2125 domain-containing protein [Tropicibacter alexandrii]
MTRYTTASALALIAMAAPAFADVTPQQVWDDLKAYYGGFGYEVTATETMDGGDLVVSDMNLTVPVPEEDTTIAMTWPEMTFADNGDGTVNLTMPETSTMTVLISEDDEQVGEVVFDLSMPGLSMLISGTATSMNYDMSADEIAMTLSKLVTEGEEIPRDMMRAQASMGPISGTMSTASGDGMRSIAQELTYGDLTYDIAFNDPDSDDAGMFKGMLSGLSISGTVEMPTDVDYVNDPLAFFTPDMLIDLVMAHTGGNSEFSVTERQGTTNGKFSSTGGEFGFAMSAADMLYAISGTGLSVDLSGPELPLPVSAQMGEFGFSIEMPLAQADAPQDASLSVVLSEFTMADMLWNIFDPANVLPRDPATVAANLNAKVTPFVDLFDEEAMMEMERNGGMPGELNELTLTDFVVDVAGGTVLGEGAFTFDNSDLESFDGLPRPEGELNLSIAGANGLIDNLIQMGLVQEQDAMGARMMLGMFTVPGSEPDTATSTIVVNEQGHVLANGQRIK